VTHLNLYDTTLRDGMQGQGMSLSAAEKVRVVQALDRLGVGFVEAGFPSSNPKEAELFRLLAEVELETAQVCAFGMTRRRGLPAEEDPALRDLVGCAAPVVTFVGKTWALHLEKVTRVSPEENLSMIVDSVNYARSQGKRVVYDAEHFFDAWRDDPGYALECRDPSILVSRCKLLGLALGSCAVLAHSSAAAQESRPDTSQWKILRSAPICTCLSTGE